jgi:RNA polymerase sigma-70 factor (ECF subfamily)
MRLIKKEGVLLDSKLLENLKFDAERGLIQLMDTYMGLVYTIIKNKLGTVCSKEDIEECISTVFYELYKQRDNIDLNKGSIKSYLCVIAKRKAVDLYRANSKSISTEVQCDEGTVESNNRANIPDIETKHVLIEAIKKLGRPDSEIFIRKFYFGQSTKTIAQAFGIKENTIDKKISRGLVKLRESIGGVLLDG